MEADSVDPSWLDYFSAGVPTGEFFRMTLEDLAALIDKSAQGISRVNEVTYIGLIAYFEAFCKDHFASVLNIEPSLLQRLKQQGQDIQVDPTRLLEVGAEWPYRLGFIVGEKYDFGTPQRINALFSAMLKLTPFSKDEARFYDGMLNDRNLLVHHGGTYTFNYVSQTKLEWKETGHGPYFGSIVVTTDYFHKRLEFVQDMAQKILRGTHAAMTAYLMESSVKYSEQRQKALDAFLWWGD